MPFKRTNVKRSTGVKKRRVFKKKPTRVSAPVRSYVNRVIARSEETKISSYSYTLTTFNAGITANADLIKVLPIVTLGTDSHNRIGHQIRPVKLVIRGYVCYDTIASSALPDARMLGVRMFVFQDKTSKCYANAIYNFNLLEEGDGTSGQFTGQAIQYVRPHNKDQFTFFADKKWTIQKPWGLTNNVTPTVSNAITCMNSTMFRPFTITLGPKQLPAKLIYDQTDDTNYPVNFAPQLALGYCDLLGAGADTSTTQIKMEYEVSLFYKDS